MKNVDSVIRSAQRHRNRLGRLVVALVLGGAVLLPSTARADEEEGPPDARLTGFAKPVTLASGSTATSWIFLVFLGVVSLSTLFKDAKRTHLD